MEAGIPSISRSLTGKAQKTVSKGRAAKIISSDRQRQAATIVLVQMQVATIALAQATRTDPKVALTAPVAAARVIWTARLRIDRAADNRANVSRAFKAAALIASVAEEDSAVTDLVAEGALAEEDLVDLAEAAEEDSEAADSGAAGKN